MDGGIKPTKRQRKTKPHKPRKERQLDEARADEASQQVTLETRPDIARRPQVRAAVKKAIREEAERVANTEPPPTDGSVDKRKWGRNQTLNVAALKLGHLHRDGGVEYDAIEAPLLAAATKCGLLEAEGEEACLATIRSGWTAGIAQPRDLSHIGAKVEVTAASWDEPVDGDGGDDGDDDDDDLDGLCLTLADWEEADIAPPDFLLGEILSTVTRGMMYAPTGLGKTNIGMGLAFGMARGTGFLHWKSKRPARVLYVDGEMSRRLFKKRLRDATRRAGGRPDTLFALCRDGAKGMQPLNTPQGQRFIEKIIRKVGGVDFVVFDNIMSLIPGDMREGETWQQTLPWILSLTERSIGQLWIHHTGHDESHAYGAKEKEWQLDIVISLKRAANSTDDIAVILDFPKAREREPDNRADFEPVKIRLAGDKWHGDRGVVAPRPVKKGPTPTEQKAFDVLLECIKAHGTAKQIGDERSVTTHQWQDALLEVGMLDHAKKWESERSRFANWKTNLIGKGLVAQVRDRVWPLVVTVSSKVRVAQAADFEEPTDA
jgi:hypothetical protein